MRKYVLLFALILFLANVGYAVGQLASGTDRLVSRPFLLGSTSAAVVALFVIRKRLRHPGNPDKK